MRDIMHRFSAGSFRRINVVIFGTGQKAIKLAASLRFNNIYNVLFFVDNNRSMKDRDIYGIPIRNSQSLYAYKSKISEIFLAKSRLSRSAKKNIVKDAQYLGFKIKEIPSIDDIALGKVTFNDLKPIKIDQILGRDLNLKENEQNYPKNIFKNILITGAGGSIGSELTKKIKNLDPKNIVILDNSEANLYVIHQELLLYKLSKIKIIPILGDATSKILIENLIDQYQINLIIHAAAYKHVPLVESNPIQGIFNNVFSTKVLCEAALKFKVSQFILISTDKAVRPTNVMGASKRIAELIVQSYSQKQVHYEKDSVVVKFSIVRFGNVLGSSGSVLPLFEKQIMQGGPITLTHENIVRYFMTISEAAQLVIQTISLTKGGEIFVLDMGEPVKIKDLAIQMINLSGLSLKDQNNPDGDIEIVCTGLRRGEKLYEELLIDGNLEPTKNPLIFKGTENFIPFNQLDDQLMELKKELKNLNKDKVFNIVLRLVPEWKKS